MTWNIRHGLGNDGRVDLDRIARVIRDSGAAIVALQEVDRGWARSGGTDQAVELARKLDKNHVFGPNLVRPDEGYGIPAAYGTAILSRFPIVAHTNTTLPTRQSAERRGLLCATCEFPGAGQLRVECTHLHWGADTTPDESVAERREQVRALLNHERPQGIPTLLMGDFNATPGSHDLADLERPGSGFVDAWLTRNPTAPGHTIPVEAPARRIDYVWLAGPVTCTAIAVLDSAEAHVASDHFPVVADLDIVD